MFLPGISFFGWVNGVNVTPTNVYNINKITLEKGVFDELFVTKNVDGELISTIPQIWDFDTILHPNFNGDLFGGNSKFTAETVTNFRIKRRKKGTFQWLTLIDIPINDEADMNSVQYDYLNASNQEYEYSLVPVFNDIEGNIDITSVLSKFNGLYILDRDQAYHAFVNMRYPRETRQIERSIVKPLDSKYPYIIANSKQDSKEFTVEATFVAENSEYKDTACLDFENGWKHREEVYDFIDNGKIKVIKYDDGRSYLVSTVSAPTEAFEHFQNVITTFNFNTVGNVDSQADLFDAGLVDKDGE